MAVIVAILALVVLDVRLGAQAGNRAGATGEQLYQTACAACHGDDGRGQPLATRGFETEPPDFTDCSLTTPEADLDWHSVIHQGGPVRGFDRMMPAFGDELTDAEIATVIAHVRGFCAERGWPHGDLNMPRALVTEKAYPENEAVLTLTSARGDSRRLRSEWLYEHRVGRRGQYEIFAHDVEEIGGAYKHVLFDNWTTGSIFSGGGEVAFNDSGTVFEAFGAFSQTLPYVPDGFLHVHGGVEIPTARDAANEVFWRTAIGKTFMMHGWGRAWSPMVELLAARDIQTAAETEWDALPQVQVSLSTRQHVLFNVGVRVPLTNRSTRRTSVMAYLLWDWFDGGFLSGW
jgi:mono/diheme cytochrome c family protein